MSDRRSFLKSLFALPFLSRFGAGRAGLRLARLSPAKFAQAISQPLRNPIYTNCNLEQIFIPGELEVDPNIEMIPEVELVVGESSVDVPIHEPWVPEVISQNELDDINPASAEVFDEVLKKFNPDLNPSDLDGVEAVLNPLQDDVVDQLTDWLFKEVEPSVVVNFIPKPELRSAKTFGELKKAYGYKKPEFLTKNEQVIIDMLDAEPISTYMTKIHKIEKYLRNAVENPLTENEENVVHESPRREGPIVRQTSKMKRIHSWYSAAEVLMTHHPELNGSEIEGIDSYINDPDCLDEYLKEDNSILSILVSQWPCIKPVVDLAAGEFTKFLKSTLGPRISSVYKNITEDDSDPSEVEPAYDQDEYLESISYLVDQSFTW